MKNKFIKNYTLFISSLCLYYHYLYTRFPRISSWTPGDTYIGEHTGYDLIITDSSGNVSIKSIDLLEDDNGNISIY